jgi:hypothetical protein
MLSKFGILEKQFLLKNKKKSEKGSGNEILHIQIQKAFDSDCIFQNSLLKNKILI